MSDDLYRQIREEEQARLRESGEWAARLDDAASLLDALLLDDDFTGFLTLPGYQKLD